VSEWTGGRYLGKADPAESWRALPGSHSFKLQEQQFASFKKPSATQAAECACCGAVVGAGVELKDGQRWRPESPIVRRLKDRYTKNLDEAAYAEFCGWWASWGTVPAGGD